MAITYPVDVVNTRWVIYYLPTNSIVARNRVWPVADGSAIQGQDPDFIYLLQITNAQPEYDARLFTLAGTETVDVPANELRVTWDAVARPTAERVSAAENEESARLAELIPIARELATTRLMVGALLNRVINAENPPPKVVTMANAYIVETVKLWQNRGRLDAIVTDINAGLDPDLDTGWAP